MNRPNYEKYKYTYATPNLSYLKDLEEYCDWLEDKIETAKGKSLFQYIDQLEEENRQLRVKLDKNKKALDTSCEKLELISELSVNGEYDEISKNVLVYGMHTNKKEWKDKFLENE